MSKVILLISFVTITAFLNAQNGVNNNAIISNQSKFVDSIKIGRFHVRFTNQFDQSAKIKAKKGLVWLDSLMNTENFKNGVKRLKYKHSKIKNKVDRKCIAEPRLSKRYQGVEIYELLHTGDDGLGKAKDGVIDLFLDLNPELKGNVLGSTTCGSIISGKSFFDNNKPEIYAAHLLHEYMHVLGFNHFLNKPLFRSFFLKKNDPPYLVGRLVRNMNPN